MCNHHYGMAEINELLGQMVDVKLHTPGLGVEVVCYHSYVEWHDVEARRKMGFSCEVGIVFVRISCTFYHLARSFAALKQTVEILPRKKLNIWQHCLLDLLIYTLLYTFN